jgi:predicted thioredoxin/glutaredoxin
MKTNFIKIIECFNIIGIGLLAELQHFENGIPSNTKLINSESEESWVVKKRVLSGTLLIADSETYFDSETEFEHISHSFKTDNDRQIAIDKELNKRENGIFWYLLVSERKNKKVKPDNGSSWEIKRK